MILIAKWIVVLFGVFLICTGFLMLMNPNKARRIISKAGSTILINYTEITIRMIPAIALILYSDYSKFAEAFKVFGWFMLITSLVLYFVPRKMHHNFSLKASKLLSPNLLRIIAPFSLLFGSLIIYAVI